MRLEDEVSRCHGLGLGPLLWAARSWASLPMPSCSRSAAICVSASTARLGTPRGGSEEPHADLGAAPALVGELRDKEGEGLEVAGHLERSAVHGLEADVADESPNDPLRSVVIAAVANRGTFGEYRRAGAQELRRHGIERLHHTRGLRAARHKLTTRHPMTDRKGVIGSGHRVRAIDESLATQA